MNISYTLLDGSNDLARLTKRTVFQTPITGYAARFLEKNTEVRLYESGRLTIGVGFVWDFGSGPAIDTPDMVIASLAHDALGRLADRRGLDGKFRKQSDKYFRQLLRDNGASWFRAWYAYIAVRAYSLFIA